ncbi:hypothetical protein PNOK_0282600 [Pyrrhoderma noxium]|uniref:Uncharacterized protein n=1 Tax=Pyrrhoderma noxium TaxID=2282107 RepID=A0A286UTH0_9AGAM|nr:hypothetical protein PNOK_0282600 [Pyrrhoderma noxium]
MASYVNHVMELESGVRPLYVGITVKNNGRKKIQTLDSVRAPRFRNAAILYGRETLLGARWIRCTLHLKSNLTLFFRRSHEICGYMRTTNSLPWELEVKALKITIPVSVLKGQLPDPDVSRGCFPRELRLFGVPIGCRSFSVSSAVPSPELTIGLGAEFLVFYNLCGGRYLLRTDSDETIIRKSCDKHRDLPKPSRMNKEIRI